MKRSRASKAGYITANIVLAVLAVFTVTLLVLTIKDVISLTLGETVEVVSIIAAITLWCAVRIGGDKYD